MFKHPDLKMFGLSQIQQLCVIFNHLKLSVAVVGENFNF